MEIKRLGSNDITKARQLATVFSDAFGDDFDYTDSAVTDEYFTSLLTSPMNIVLAANNDMGDVVGGILAYELTKLQGEREIYLYDLAVAETYRRQGIATALIEELKVIGKSAGASVIFVQADNVDTAAVALYTKLSDRVETDISHFDIRI